MASAGPLVRGLLSALVAVVAVAAVGLGVFAWDRLSDGDRSQTIPIATAQPRSATDCPRAQPNLFAALSAHLAVRSDRFGSAQYAVEQDGLTYLTAPVANGTGGLRATEPVWVYGGSGYAWVNEPARRLSSGLPDARTAYGVDPSGPVAVRLVSCRTAG